MRLPLDPPTRSDLAAYLARFAESLDQPLGRTPATIARRLRAVSYAEAEEFCRNVRRRAALATGEKTLAAIVAERLTLWYERLRASVDGDEPDGGVPLLPIPNRESDRRLCGSRGVRDRRSSASRRCLSPHIGLERYVIVHAIVIVIFFRHRDVVDNE